MAIARIGAFSGRKTTASAADQPVSTLLSRVRPAAGVSALRGTADITRAMPVIPR
jgi:hypothetical protein